MLEGWLDSLALSRRSAETVIRPDTDGLLGGRYRGKLSRTGEYTPTVRPFVPDEVSEVSDMAKAMDDFFPPLPQRGLQPGEVWTNSRGLTISRLPDSASSGLALQRFQVDKHEESRSAEAPADTLPLEIQQKTEEAGQFVWHPRFGLLQRQRAIVVETTVPPSRSVRQAVRSRVEQHVTLNRDLTARPCPASAER